MAPSHQEKLLGEAPTHSQEDLTLGSKWAPCVSCCLHALSGSGLASAVATARLTPLRPQFQV